MVNGGPPSSTQTRNFSKFIKSYANKTPEAQTFTFGRQEYMTDSSVRKSNSETFSNYKVQGQHNASEIDQSVKNMEIMGGKADGPFSAEVDKKSFLAHFKTQLGDKFEGMKDKLSALFDSGDQDGNKKLSSDEFGSIIHTIDIQDGTYNGEINQENMDNFFAAHTGKNGKLDVKGMKSEIGSVGNKLHDSAEFNPNNKISDTATKEDMEIDQ